MKIDECRHGVTHLAYCAKCEKPNTWGIEDLINLRDWYQKRADKVQREINDLIMDGLDKKRGNK